jgi:hypothetical protein
MDTWIVIGVVGLFLLFGIFMDWARGNIKELKEKANDFKIRLDAINRRSCRVSGAFDEIARDRKIIQIEQRIDALESRLPEPPEEKRIIIDSIDSVRVYPADHTAEQLGNNLIIRDKDNKTVAEFAEWTSWRYE